jgi:hypothetical protein
MSRAGIQLANGFPVDDEDDDEDEVDEDYAAVDQSNAPARGKLPLLSHNLPHSMRRAIGRKGAAHPAWFRRPPSHNRTKLDELHPFVQLLSASNVEDCVKVWEIVCVVILINRSIVLVHLVLVVVLIIDREPIGMSCTLSSNCSPHRMWKIV